MEANRKSQCWAAGLVSFAIVIQAISWWMLWDGSTFGPKGVGTQAITGLFGANTFPAVIAIRLDSVVRGAILLTLGVLTFGSLMPEPVRRYGSRRDSGSRSDQVAEFEW